MNSIKTIGIDTSVFNNLYTQQVSGYSFLNTLKNQNLTPYVCLTVLYELEKIFYGKKTNVQKGIQIFSILRDLNPQYITHRHAIYNLELKKLRNSKKVFFEVGQSMSEQIKERINNYATGIVIEDFEKYIEQREKNLRNIIEKLWKRTSSKKMKQNDFDLEIKNLFDCIKKGDSAYIRYIQEMIYYTTEMKIMLSSKEVIEVISNTQNYPALGGLIRLHFYLTFLTECNHLMGVACSRDRFSDGLIVLEYAYCDGFLSADKNLIIKHARAINPHIKLIPYTDNFEELIYNFQIHN